MNIEVFSGRNDSPDPAAYDVDKGLKVVKDHSPEWRYVTMDIILYSFSKTNRPNIRDNNPGPGAYE